MICDVNVKPCIMLCMCPRLFLSFAPSCNKPNNFHGCFQFPPHPKKKKKKILFSVGREYFHSCLSEWHDSDWRRDSHGAKNKNTLNDRWLRMEVKVFNRRHSQRADKHTAATALVLWNYNNALEPKCMLSEVTPMLLHTCLVSAECF